MTSTLDPQSLAEVPVRSPPLKLRIASAVNSLASNLYYRKDGTVNRGLMNRLDQKAAATPKPVGGVSSKDIIYDQDTKQSVRIYTPSQKQVEESKRKLPLIIYFHGGGFVAFDAASKMFDVLARSLAKACNAVVVSVNYRLAPEFRYPAAYDDCFQALRWVQSEFLSGGDLSSLADPSKCFLVGDSAGGNIAHFMMVRAAQNDLSPVAIRGGILFAPFFGGAERSPNEVKVPNGLIIPLWVADWFWAAFLPVGSDRDHPACNVFGPHAEDISCLSLPPILVTIGSLDILQDWQDVLFHRGSSLLVFCLWCDSACDSGSDRCISAHVYCPSNFSTWEFSQSFSLEFCSVRSLRKPRKCRALYLQWTLDNQVTRYFTRLHTKQGVRERV